MNNVNIVIIQILLRKVLCRTAQAYLCTQNLTVSSLCVAAITLTLPNFLTVASFMALSITLSYIADVLSKSGLIGSSYLKIVHNASFSIMLNMSMRE